MRVAANGGFGLYGEADKKKALGARNRAMRVVWVVCAVALALTVTGFVIRMKYLSLAALILGGCVVYGWVSLKVMPWIAYLRLLREMESGLRKQTVGAFVAAGEDSRMVDGVSVHDVMLDAGQDADLLFYWDDDKPRPEFAPGQRLKVTSFGKFITGWEKVGQPEGA